MLFNSIQFAIFFPIVYGLYLVLSHKWKNRMLLVASYVFYAACDLPPRTSPPSKLDSEPFEVHSTG